MPKPHPPLRVMSSESDEALLSRGLGGDEQALGELVERHREAVFRLLRRYTPRPEDARDLTQRAFLQALEATGRTLPRLGSAVEFRSWLFRIAVNLGKNFAKAARRWPLTSVEAAAPLADARADASEQLDRAQRTRLVQDAVLELPARQREVLTLRLDAQRPFSEIAGVLGITEAAAKASFHLAVKRLKERVRSLQDKEER